MTNLPQERTDAAVGLPIEKLPAVLRPNPNLLKYYALTSLLAGPGFPVLMLVLYFRYHTLRYDVDAEGITMRWGILFRREVLLTYARIQDIHLTSNLVERWLGLAKIQVQTASGSSSAEMTIEGVSFFQEMRDFLYARMRGARSHKHDERALAPATAAAPGADELTATLRDVAAELRALRASMADRDV
jgi:putative membrane protein